MHFELETLPLADIGFILIALSVFIFNVKYRATKNLFAIIISAVVVVAFSYKFYTWADEYWEIEAEKTRTVK